MDRYVFMKIFLSSHHNLASLNGAAFQAVVYSYVQLVQGLTLFMIRCLDVKSDMTQVFSMRMLP